MDGMDTMAHMEQEHRSPLGQLFDEICRVQGWSHQDVADRSMLRGEGLVKSRVGQLVNPNPLERISRGNIIALANGLGISPERVALAVIQSMGFKVADAGISPAEAIARDPHLSLDTKDALLSIIRNAEGRRGA